MPVFAGIAAIQDGTPVPLAWVHWKRRAIRSEVPEFFIEATVEGALTLLPCRRVNRVDDPYGVYFIDGQPWCSYTEQLAGPVQAKLVGADIRLGTPEVIRCLLPQLAALVSNEIS